ncbi:uncharacterized protein JCM10292_005006 [Rhodotorula paludigena]|uniref:uncharacterized protein n=1 Tax=Rhodotorula paludigena TaxID=86838 RepID=UPI00317638FE
MSVTRLASLADLPAELRDRILKSALRYDFDAMRVLCKVSKGLNELLKPQLYEIIERWKAEDDALDGSADDDDETQSSDAVFNTAPKRMLIALERFPHNAKLVRKLHFNGLFDGRATARAVRRVTRVCHDIEEARFIRHPLRAGYGENEDEPDDSYHWLFEALRDTMPKLRKLTMRGADVCNNGDFVEGLSPLAQLKDLSISFARPNAYRTLGDEQIPEYAFQLERLEVGSDANPRIVEAMLAKSKETLRTLSLALWQKAHNLAPYTAVEDLTLVYCRPRVAALMLKTAPASLRSLTLRWDPTVGVNEHGWVKSSMATPEYFARLEQRTGTFEQLLRSLPQQIRHLAILHCIGEEGHDALLERINDPTWLPNLAMLEVAYTLDRRPKKEPRVPLPTRAEREAQAVDDDGDEAWEDDAFDEGVAEDQEEDEDDYDDEDDEDNEMDAYAADERAFEAEEAKRQDEVRAALARRGAVLGPRDKDPKDALDGEGRLPRTV